MKYLFIYQLYYPVFFHATRVVEIDVIYIYIYIYINE